MKHKTTIRNQNKPTNQSERLSSCDYHKCNVIHINVIKMNVISYNLNMTGNMNTPLSVQRVFSCPQLD